MTAAEVYVDPSALELKLRRFLTFDAAQQKLAAAAGLRLIYV